MKVKPCPFCGYRNPPEDGKHLISSYFVVTSIGDGWAVVCPNCNAQGPLDTEEDAMLMWNHRGGSLENVEREETKNPL